MNTEDANRPTPEMLAAYVDGELSPRESGIVDHWLTDHPDTRAELDAHRRLGRLWQATRPTEPGDRTWTTVVARIGDRLPVSPLAHPHRRFPFRWLAGLAAAAAVVSVVWILTSQLRTPDRTPVANRDSNEPPFPVASADDVVITSLSDADDDLVLVGLPPLRGPMILADPGDVRVEDMPPNGQFSEPPKTPMFDMQPAAPK